MLTAAYVVFALVQLVLGVWAVALYLRRPSIGAFTVALPIVLLVWDNAVVAIGALVGEGELLQLLSWPRFAGHAFLTPVWIVTGFEYARRGGVSWLESRGSKVFEWVLYGAMVLLGVLRSLVLLDMQPVRQAELLYYTNKGGFPGPPIPALVMVVVVLAAGVALLRRLGWPWLLVGGVIMFVAAAIPTSVVGFWVSNLGEVALSFALVLTEGYLQGRESELERPRSTRFCRCGCGLAPSSPGREGDLMESWFWPAATGVLVVVFDVLLWRQYAQRRKVHQLWWAIGFALYAASAFLELIAATQGGWTPLLFRVYAITTAVLVPTLAMGTVELAAHKRTWPRIYLGYNIAIVVVWVFAALTRSLDPVELAKGALSSYAPFGGTAMTYPRVLSMLLTIPGALVLFWGAVLSIFRFIRKKEYAYRVWANVLIAAATLVISSGGGMAKAGNTTMFYLTEMLAAVLFFAGFLMAGTLRKGADRILAEKHAERGA